MCNYFGHKSVQEVPCAEECSGSRREEYGSCDHLLEYLSWVQLTLKGRTGTCGARAMH
jgi:hypothetical protein